MTTFRPWPTDLALDSAAAAELLAHCPTGLVRIDATGAATWANAAARALLPAGMPCPWPDAGHGTEFDGAAGPVRATSRALPGGGRVVTLEPIAELAQARRDAERGNELLALARNHGRLGTWGRDLLTGKGWWDPEVFRIRGLTGEGQAPTLEEALALVLPEDRAEFLRVFEDSQRQPGQYQHRYRVHTPGGELRMLQSQWLIKAGPDGRPAQAIGMVFDDSEAYARAREYETLLSQLAMAVDLAGLAIWRHDLIADRMYYNDQGFRVLQMAPRPEGLSLAEVRNLIHPDDLPLVLASAEQALRTGLPTDMEARYRRADGQWRTVMTRRVLQRAPDGTPQAFLGMALDVTDRIDESRRAVELGGRFDLATRAAGIGYWILEGRAERARWSDTLRAIHALPDTEPVPTLKEWMQRFLHPEDAPLIDSRMKEWLKSGRPAFGMDLRVRSPDGEVRHLIVHVQIEGRDLHRVVFGLVIDVTERRRAELALREAGERAALAARGAGLGTWEIDLRDLSCHWDPQMWRLRGLEPRTESPDPDEQLAMLHPEDLALARTQYDLLVSDDAPHNYEFRVVLPDGRVRWLASRSMPVRDEHGRLVRRIGVNWDVTDSRTAEAVRQEREIALRESQAKSKFLARMSHELRTPLNGVLGFAQLLLAEDDGSDAAAAARRRRVQQIQAAGQHLLSLINDVLDLSSLEGGELRIALQPVPLGPVVAATTPLLEAAMREQRIEFHCGPVDVVPLADATRLRQVLLNLLSNAIKYNRPGGRVTLEAMQTGSGVVIRVADTGRGMSDDQLRHLFEPFNRLGAEGEGIEGTGIGLAIVKALVERMGGSVHVDSTEGVGSLFELRLSDASARPPAPSPAPASSRPIPLAGGRSRRAARCSTWRTTRSTRSSSRS